MSQIEFWLTVVGMLCWPICFWWMHRISSRQVAMMREMSEQNARIEEVSREERELIKDVHPKVGEIRDAIGQVKTAVEGA